MDVKDNLAQNLTRYRKSLGLTQAELAEKLNYTDKAVSKWERGESVPDLFVLKKLADMYGVKIDTLISEPKKDKPTLLKNISKKRTIICLCCAGLVWLIAILCYSLLGIIDPSITHSWLSFIYAIPITCVILLILTAVWHKKLTNTIFISILIWSIILAIYLSLYFLLPVTVNNLWMIFLIGIPAQALTIFWFWYRKVK
jgi:transcriptional regulator with XRE-family HTH domain